MNHLPSSDSATRSAPPPPRVPLLDIAYDTVRLADVMARIRTACADHRSLQIATVNLSFVALARQDARFAQAIRGADLAVMDGRVLQWLTMLLGRPAPEQITGHDLVRECVALAHASGAGVFLLGGAAGVAQQAAAQLARDHPGLRVAGTHHGAFTPSGETADQAALTRQIRAFRPDFLFVALGAPKQDLWLARQLKDTGVPVGIGVGGVLDVLSGRMPRPPTWVRHGGLESPFRVLTAPRRYAKRYLVDDLPTLARLLRLALRRRAHLSLRSSAGGL
jgi:N-acetylglucosaminyldiphosphoundecaprenol N-acetyl-beta-D-mannosaminyltransferase